MAGVLAGSVLACLFDFRRVLLVIFGIIFLFLIFPFLDVSAQTITNTEIHNHSGGLVQDRDNDNTCDISPDTVRANTANSNGNIGIYADSVSPADCSRAWVSFTPSGLPTYEYSITNIKIRFSAQNIIQPDISSLLRFDFRLMDDINADSSIRWTDIRDGDTIATLSLGSCEGCTGSTAPFTQYTLDISDQTEIKRKILNGDDIHIGVLMRNDDRVPSYASQHQVMNLGDINGGTDGHTLLLITTEPVIHTPDPPANFTATSITQQALTFMWTPPSTEPSSYQLNITRASGILETHTVSGTANMYTLTYDPYLSCTDNVSASIRSVNTGSTNNTYYSTTIGPLTFQPACIEYYSSHIEKGPPPTANSFTYADNPERYAPLTMSELQGGDVLVTMSADEFANQYDYTLYTCSDIDYPIIDRLPLFPYIASNQSSKYTSVGLGEYIEGEQTPALIKYKQTCDNTRYCKFQSGIHYGETNLLSTLTIDGLITDVRGTYTVSNSGQQYSRYQIWTDVLFQNSTDGTIHNYQGRTQGAYDRTINIESEYDRDINITTSYGRDGTWGYKPQQYQGSSGLFTSPLNIFHEDTGGNLLKRSYTQNGGTIIDDVEKGDVLVIMGYGYSPASTAPITQKGYTEFQARYNQSAPTAKLTAYFVQSDRDKADLISVSGSVHGYLIKPLYDLNAVRHLEHGIVIPEYMLTEHESLTCTAKKHVLHRDDIKEHVTIATTIQYEHPAEQCISEVHNMPNTPLTRAFDVQYEDILPDNHCSVLGNAIDRKQFVSPVPPSEIEGIGNFTDIDGDHPQPTDISYFGSHTTRATLGEIVFNPNRGVLFPDRAHIQWCEVTDPISGFTTRADKNAGIALEGWCTGHDYNYCHSVTVCKDNFWGKYDCNESSGQVPHWFAERQLEYECFTFHDGEYHGTIEPSKPFYESVIHEINSNTFGWGGTAERIRKLYGYRQRTPATNGHIIFR